MGRTVDRLVSLLSEEPGISILIHGASGSGKTSLVNLVVLEAENKSAGGEKTIFIRVDLWGQDENRIVSTILERVVRVLSERGVSRGWGKELPSAYSYLLNGSGSIWIDALLAFLTPIESEDLQLQRLDRMLLEEHRRLVVILEDLDRVPREPRRLSAEIEDLLDRLRKLHKIAVICTIKFDAFPSDVIDRVFNEYEEVKPLRIDEIAQWVDDLLAEVMPALSPYKPEAKPLDAYTATHLHGKRNLLHDVLADAVPSLRSWKRFEESVRTRAKRLKNNYSPDDLFIVEALRLLHPAIPRVIADNFELLGAEERGSEIYRMAIQNERPKVLEELQRLAPKPAGVALRLLDLLFKTVRDHPMRVSGPSGKMILQNMNESGSNDTVFPPLIEWLRQYHETHDEAVLLKSVLLSEQPGRSFDLLQAYANCSGKSFWTHIDGPSRVSLAIAYCKSLLNPGLRVLRKGSMYFVGHAELYWLLDSYTESSEVATIEDRIKPVLKDFIHRDLSGLREAFGLTTELFDRVGLRDKSRALRDWLVAEIQQSFRSRNLKPSSLTGLEPRTPLWDYCLSHLVRLYTFDPSSARFGAPQRKVVSPETKVEWGWLAEFFLDFDEEHAPTLLVCCACLFVDSNSLWHDAYRDENGRPRSTESRNEDLWELLMTRQSCAHLVELANKVGDKALETLPMDRQSFPCLRNFLEWLRSGEALASLGGAGTER